MTDAKDIELVGISVEEAAATAAAIKFAMQHGAKHSGLAEGMARCGLTLVKHFGQDTINEHLERMQLAHDPAFMEAKPMQAEISDKKGKVVNKKIVAVGMSEMNWQMLGAVIGKWMHSYKPFEDMPESDTEGDEDLFNFSGEFMLKLNEAINEARKGNADGRKKTKKKAKKS